MSLDTEEKYDLTKMIAGVLYQGIFINIIIPAGLLMAVYYLDKRGGVSNSVGDFSNILFFLLGAVSLVEGAGAVLWRTKALNRPMVRRKETIETDIREELKVRLKPIFLLIAAIALNGIIYFLLTGRFDEGLAFVILSFIAFQIVRPRFGMLRKVIETQERLVEQGQFMGR